MDIALARQLGSFLGCDVTGLAPVFTHDTRRQIFYVRAGHARYLAKIAREPAHAERLRNEACVLHRLHQQGSRLHCPVMQIVKDDGCELVTLQTYLEGTPLVELQKDVLPVQPWRVAICDVLDALAAIPVPPQEDAQPERAFRHLMAQLQADAFVVKRLGVLSAADIAHVSSFVTRGLTALAHRPPPVRFVHGDLSPMNLLVQETIDGIKLSVIDFEYSHWGFPHENLTKLLWLFRRQPRLDAAFFATGEDDGWVDELNVYFVLDILHHFAQADRLSVHPVWRAYLREEAAILQELDDAVAGKPLWQRKGDWA